MSNIKVINMTEKKDLLIKAYNNLLNTGFGDAPLNEISLFIDDKVMGFGTAQDEKIMSRYEFTDLIVEQRKQAEIFDDFSFKSNPILTEIYNDGKTGIVVDEIELITVIEKEKNNLSLRMSTVFEMINDNWKLIHWHGSKAEHVSGGEDPWHVNEWKKKNDELQKLVDEKTVELINKNTELEIEASLERVRSVAMGMSKSEDLIDICEVTFNELTKLGFKAIRNAVIHIPNDQEKYFMDYDYSDFTGGVVAKINYGLHPIVDEYIEKIRSAADAYFEVVITEDQLKGWNEFRKESGQADDPRLINATSIYYYLFSIGVGDIGISTFKPIDKSQIKLLQRFRNVFDLAYKRFTDIEKAEQQAYEAQIEAALERVRARTMAMQNSDELPEVANVIFLQIQSLGIPTWSTSYNLLAEDKKSCICIPSSEGEVQTAFNLPFEGEKSFHEWIKAIESGDNFFVQELGGKDLQEHYQYLLSLPGVHQAIEPLEKAGISLPKYQINHLSFFKHGFLLFITYKHVTDAHDIFKRFTLVFEQTYTRFLDLKKAEQQAREAQIDVGLERVRSQSMMMQRSEDLTKTSKVFHEQLYLLGIESEFSYLWLPNEEKLEHMFWATWHDDKHGSSNYKNKKVIYPLDKSEPSITDCYKAWNSDQPVHETRVQPDGVKDYFNEWPELLEGVDKFKSKNYPDGLYYVDAYMKYGCFGVMIRNQLSKDDKHILHRFSKEFEQAYTRFLDLQKAEAQAREAQIETALEKVRSRTMAMQKGEELKEVVVLLYKELITLGVNNFVTCGYVEINENMNRQFTWVTSPGGDSLGLFYLPLTGDETFDERYSAWKQQQIIFHQKVAGEVRRKHLEYAITTFNSKEAEEMVLVQFPDPCVFYCFNFSHGYLHLVTGSKLKKEEELLLARFTRVFEQTYARFLDLQKAEEQAREGRIQLALEKVRMVALGLKKSEEMLEVAKVLYEQLLWLGFSNIRNAIIDINNEDDDDTFTDYDYSHDMSGTITQMSYHDDPTLEGQFKKTTATIDDFFELVLEGKELENLINMRLKNGEAEDPRLLNADLVTYNLFSFGNGAIGISNFGLLNADEKSILRRFSNVFTFAYKRYNDLASAEAQAREAQIEAALERVRAKAMAMHSSEDLAQTVDTFFLELNRLNVKPHRCGVGIVDAATRTTDIKATTITPEGKVKKITGILKLYGHPVLDNIFEHWEMQKEYHPVLRGEEIKDYYKVMNPQITFPDFADDEIQHGYYFMFKEGGVFAWTDKAYSESELQIFRRYTSVLSLTYRRYIDLVKAEEQNKIIQEENDRKTQELEEARQLQLAMLPKELPQLPNLDIAVYMNTATEVGGDYYDFHQNPDGTLTVIIGDATGHGMKAGSMVTVSKSLFNTLAMSKDIQKTFKRMSRVIKDMKFLNLSMCLTMLKMNDNRLQISSAGMPPVLLYRAEVNTVEEFAINGMPLGTFNDFPYDLKEIELNKGDTLLLMSDGFPELMNEKNELYGYERVAEKFQDIAKYKPKKIINELQKEESKWVGNSDPDDDVTFVVIKVK